MSHYGLYGVIAVLLLITAALSFQTVTTPIQPPIVVDPDLPGDTQQLKTFTNSKEIVEFLKKTATQVGYLDYGVRGGMLMEETLAPTAAPMAGEAQDAAKTVATDFSQTNVQVKGVDEADFVKNDNKYIYIISGSSLVIADAYPGEDAEILSETEIEGTPSEMFINKDRLILFTNNYEKTFTIPEFDFEPRERYSPMMYVTVYDVSDRTEPEVVNEYSVNGNYYDARMIDNFVYVISKENIYYHRDIVDIPVIFESGRKLMQPEVYYFDNPENNYVFHTVSSFDIFGEKVDAKTFMLGHSNNLYVSKDNIYLSYQKNLPYYRQISNNEERFYSVIVPLLPDDIQSQVNSIKNSNLGSQEKWESISVILQDMYNNMDEDDKQKLISNIRQAVEEYEIRQEQERRKTVIHKIIIDNGDIQYDTRGEVNGYLLNQFSLDEFEGNLRVATTTYIYHRGAQMYNNVYILDGNMNVIGQIEDIAPDEKIYSTRFIGERLYMVTFKRIDPFFVIDLAPTNPKILGELKIPGFSDYLHPYDENHIIGIGKETESNQWGGVSVSGLKLALFDVSDVENPEQVDRYEIGDRGTDSEALNEHKAFLFDKEKGIIVIPVREVKERIYDERMGYYRWDIWQGAYVLNIDEDGFGLRGTINHGSESDDRYYYGSPYAVRRSLFMDDYLYTISGKMIKVNDLVDIDRDINELDLPYTDNRHYPYPVPMEEPVEVME